MEKHFSYGNCERSMLAKVKENNKYDYADSIYDNCSLDDRDSSHMQIIRLVKDGMKILDVGCANGLLGMLIKKFRKCTIDGIEYDEEASIIASKRDEYRDVYNCSILDEKDLSKTMKKNQKYDCIIFGDVLEHLYDPWKAIYNVSSLLDKNGEIIISLPCIDNFDVIKGLINGEFNYNTFGILDTTHIRFFTVSSFVEMMENFSEQYGISFDIELCGQTHFLPPYSLDDSFVNILKESDCDIKDFFVMQNVFKLTFSKNKKSKLKGMIDKKTNYEDVCDAISKMADKNVSLSNELRELNDKYNELNKNYASLNERYEMIVNSRSWKLRNKIRRLFKLK